MVNKEKLKDILEKVKVGDISDLDRYLEDLESNDDINPVIDKMKNINSDIKSLDNRFREQKRIYSTLVDNLPGAVYRSENDYRWPFSYVSEGIKSITGHTADEFITKSVYYGDFIAEDYKQLVWDEVQRALEAKIPFRLIYKIIHADKSERWVWEQGTAVFNEDNEFQFIEGFITEITDKIKLQADVEEDSEKLESINEALNSREVYLSKLKKSIEEVKKLIS